MKISADILIEKDAAFLFDYTQDYSKRLEWDTFLKRADIISHHQKAGLGVRTYCVARNGVGVETEYISYRRLKVTAVKIISPSLLFSEFSGSWQFKEIDQLKTNVMFTYSFEFKWPFRLVSKVIEKILLRNMRNRLYDLKLMVER